MVAQAECTVSFIPKAGQEASCRKPFGYAAQPSCGPSICTNASPSSSAPPFKRERNEGERGEASDVREGQKPLEQQKRNDVLLQKSETEKKLMSVDEGEDDEQEDRLVMADTEEEEEEEEDGKEGRQDEADELSPGSSGDESQDMATLRAPGWRKKIKQRVNFGREWVQTSIVFVSTAVGMLRLSDIERSYHAACQEEGQEPLSRSVLARLLHQQFPEAGKCRLGPRRKQKIHYSKLQWRISGSEQEQESSGGVATPVADEAVEGTPSKGTPSVESGKSLSSVSGKNADEREGMGKDKLKKSHQLEFDDRDEEGCKDAANNLKQVMQMVSQQGKRDVMLKTFAHSASCRNTSCTSLCLMFRRVRRHIMGARHACHVLRIYSFILKVHVAFCKDDTCGLTACPALRASHRMKRDWDSEQAEELQEQQQVQQPMAKRLNRQGSNIPSLTVRPLSPASSLPDSEPSTPSPSTPSPSTPSPSTSPLPTMHIMQPLQYMIVMQQPQRMMMDSSILSVHDGA